jgi:hypothetical protein
LPGRAATKLRVCDYPRARNLVLLAVAVAPEGLIRFVLDGARSGWAATLRDFAIRSLESSPRIFSLPPTV